MDGRTADGGGVHMPTRLQVSRANKQQKMCRNSEICPCEYFIYIYIYIWSFSHYPPRKPFTLSLVSHCLFLPFKAIVTRATSLRRIEH